MRAAIAALSGLALGLAGCGGNDAPRAAAGGGDPAAGKRAFVQCRACHGIGAGGGDTDGPNLYGVMGAPIAQRRPRFAYTAALQAVGGDWTPARLDAWLTNPQAFAPGTKMAFPGIADRRTRADLIAYLREQGGR